MRFLFLLQHDILVQVLGNSTQQPLALQPLLAEQTIRIPVRAVAQDRDYRVTRSQLDRQVPRSSHVQRT